MIVEVAVVDNVENGCNDDVDDESDIDDDDQRMTLRQIY